MWTSIKNLFQNAGAFLSSNKVPPNTPPELIESFRQQNHFASKKFFIVFTSFLGLCFFYFTSVGILFFLPGENKEVVAGYITIFTKTIEVLAIVIAAYLGVQAAIDFRYGSSSSTNLNVNLTSEQRELQVIEEQTILYAEKFKDEPSYAPLDWVFSKNN